MSDQDQNSLLIYEIKRHEENYLIKMFNPPKKLIDTYVEFINKNKNHNLIEHLQLIKGYVENNDGDILNYIRKSESLRLWMAKLERKIFKKAKQLKYDKWISLVERAKKRFNTSRQKIVSHNKPLLKSIVSKYSSNTDSCEFTDLMQEASLGLLRSIDKFEPEKGYKFSTYASWWVRHYIQRSISCKDKLVRLPVHLAEKISSVLRMNDAARNQNKKIMDSDDISKNFGINQSSAEALVNGHFRIKSLNTNIISGDFRSPMLIDTLMCDKSNQFDLVNGHMVRRHVRTIFNGLNPREQLILNKRFGLDGSEEKTLLEIGKELGLCRERIRQIEEVAKKKMRNHELANELQSQFQM